MRNFAGDTKKLLNNTHKTVPAFFRRNRGSFSRCFLKKGRDPERKGGKEYADDLHQRLYSDEYDE
jgi:hypothetical protein